MDFLNTNWRRAWIGVVCLVLSACEGGSEPDTLGSTTAAINGGTVVNENATPPYMVQLGNTADAHYCGGVLLSDLWVLTAAHCVKESDYPAASATVKVGEWSIANAGVNEQARAIAQVIVHPDYYFQQGGHYNDLALIRMSSPVVFNARVAPISVGTTTPGANTTGTAYGWGRIITNGPESDQLLSASLTVMSQSSCVAQWGQPALGIPITPQQFCATNPPPSYRSVDNGDSGGPFVTTSGGVATLRGVTSMALTHVSLGSVFVDVQQYRSWINEIAFNSVWVEPLADSSVMQAYPDQNFGNSSVGSVRYHTGTTYDSEIYLSFDLSGITGPVLEATLWQSCWLNTAGDPIRVRMRRTPGSLSHWEEDEITWNNRPTSGPTVVTKDVTSTLLLRYVWKSASLTSEVNSFLGGTIAFRQFGQNSLPREVRCGLREAVVPYQPVLQVRVQ